MHTHSSKKLWALRALTLVAPLLLVALRPMGMTLNQSIVAASLVLTITWWSTGLVGKVPASLFLLGMFLLFGSAPVTTVLSFPLSETFVLIVLTYLFSRGIENSGLTERTLEPLLFRFVTTPVRAVASVALVLVLTIYIIPQPLARLIIIATIYKGFLAKTTAPKETTAVVLFSVFAFYTVVNMMAVDADIILNTAAIGFAGASLANAEWMRLMAPPTLVFCAVLFGAILLVFRKHLLGVRILPKQPPQAKPPLAAKEKLTAAVVVCTIVLWAASGLLGGVLPFKINPTIVTLVGTALMFPLGVLRLKDFKAIDAVTLIFITAAFSIGGVMKASGIAEMVFSRVAKLFPAGYSLGYVAVIVLVSMGMHLILGSNTTTMSVVLPGLAMISEGVLPVNLVLLISYTSLAAHYILPFHSVSMMIGAAGGYFPQKFVPRFGAITMAVIFILIFAVYMPWWTWMGIA